MKTEVGEIRQRYERRKDKGFSSLYSPFKPVNVQIAQERERAMLKMIFAWLNGRPFNEITILEIGCGDGVNILNFVKWGATPGNIVGNELLEDRAAHAKARLPASVRIVTGDASALDLPNESIDLVLQSTVFSSVLDEQMRQTLADRCWELLKPGGAFLSVDFVFNNPANHDVKKLTILQLAALFPDGKLTAKKITLAPPIARRVVPISTWLYPFFNVWSFLRTHAICLIEKN